MGAAAAAEKNSKSNSMQRRDPHRSMFADLCRDAVTTV
jgi:hypothetical protein